jgi:uncharacterized protein YkwD
MPQAGRPWLRAEGEGMMRHCLGPLVAAVLGACLLSPGRVADGQDPPGLTLSEDEQQVLDLTNQARQKEKLPPLRPNAQLFAAARGHSVNMARQGKMEHVLDGKKPGDRVKEAGYRYSWVGENMASTDGAPVAEIFKGWMESKAHREHILSDRFDDIGIGIARNDKGDVYYTQVFASPKKKEP